MPAEPINQKVTIPLTASVKAAAELEAERTGETRSAVLRRWIRLGREAAKERADG
jgi:hypothetical protein